MPDPVLPLTALWHASRSLVAPSTLWSLALVAALAWAVVSARRNHLDPLTVYGAGLCALLGGLFGAHLLGLYVYQGCCSESPAWWRIWAGGKSYYGGLLGGAAGALLWLGLRRQPVLRHADALVPAVALGYAIGRLGCFLNGCDYGIETTGLWGIAYGPETEVFHVQREAGRLSLLATETIPVWPTQLLHSLLGWVLFAALSLVRPVPPGRRLSLFAIAYGSGRFMIELVRGDGTALLGGLSLQQLISLGLVLAGAVGMARLPRAGRATSQASSPPDPFASPPVGP